MYVGYTLNQKTDARVYFLNPRLSPKISLFISIRIKHLFLPKNLVQFGQKIVVPNTKHTLKI